MTSQSQTSQQTPGSSPDPKFVFQQCQIPVIPKHLHEILEVADGASTTAVQLERLVLKSPGLCVNLLKLVNSAAYSLSKKVTSVGQSMVLLGFSTVKSMAAGLLMLETFEKLSKTHQNIIIQVNEHSVCISSLIRILCSKESTKSADLLLLVSLAHDLGHIIMNEFFKTPYFEFFQEHPLSSSAEEQAKFGMDHALLGAELLTRWGFSKEASSMVWYHDTPIENTDKPELPESLVKPIGFFRLAELLEENKDQLETLLNEKDPQFVKIQRLLKAIEWPLSELKQSLPLIKATLKVT